MSKTMKLEQGKRYSASLSLGLIERVAGNETIATKFRDVGFTDVAVTGSGASRAVTGVWPADTREVALPAQVVAVTPA
jgi:hypothetical protein